MIGTGSYRGVVLLTDPLLRRPGPTTIPKTSGPNIPTANNVFTELFQHSRTWYMMTMLHECAEAGSTNLNAWLRSYKARFQNK